MSRSRKDYKVTFMGDEGWAVCESKVIRNDAPEGFPEDQKWMFDISVWEILPERYTDDGLAEMVMESLEAKEEARLNASA